MLQSGLVATTTPGNSKMGRNLGLAVSLVQIETVSLCFPPSLARGQSLLLSPRKPTQGQGTFHFSSAKLLPKCSNTGSEQGNKTGHNLPILELGGNWSEINQVGD